MMEDGRIVWSGELKSAFQSLIFYAIYMLLPNE
jgi:hypothetical protein